MRLMNQKGLTLVELLAVIVVLGIISAIAVPAIVGVIEKTEKDVCEAELVQFKRGYENHLVLNQLSHTDVMFSSYINEYSTGVCGGCELVYMDGEVMCSERGDEDGGDVPVL
ncbi:type II secretion system protein [Alteribacter keqinensis]|uniref:Type II secretion system protein n=1 Tax=Alteribacter keqinensis TaxID=2483800 RepID=A0A3M7TSL4_9BACI|nr:type II secretion system protein [Alteribacter keqinensis]RNA67742.1 type II secretion system protein [Alteribacter keqinensis]